MGPNVNPLIPISLFVSTYSSIKNQKFILEKYKKWFPVNPSSKLAEIIADLITDGHIQVRKIGNRKKYGYVGFFSEDYNDLHRFNKTIFDLFRIKGKIQEWGIRKNGRSKACIISSAALTRVLTLCGAPPGDKVGEIFNIPEWIENGNKEIQSAFLRRLITCDGSIGYDKNTKRWEIKYNIHKKEKLIENGIKYLEKIRKMLSNFDIETSNITIYDRYIRNKDREKILGLRFKIYKKDSIINFAKFINFDLNYKKRKLLQAMKWARKGNGWSFDQLKPVA